MLSMGMSLTGFAATNGWTQENGKWYYYDNGSKVTDEWKKSAKNYWFYLGSDGAMETDALIDNKYVNGDGAMVSNEWRKLEVDGEYSWYYFGQNGTYSSDGWKTINNKKYHFDSDGSMDYGWYDDGVYYLGTEDDGAMKTGWQYVEGPEDSGLEDEPYSFYFGTNGQLVKDKLNRKINGYTYAFDENGRMMYGWVDVTNKVMDGEDNASSDIRDYQYFKSEELKNGIDGSRVTGWKQVDAPENVRTTADDNIWYYFKDGAPYAAEDGKEYVFKSIKSKKYAFNEEGAMLHGFQYLSNESIVATTSNASVDDDTDLYYFGNEGDGAMKTGSMTLYNEDDGEKHTYYFSTNGKGYTGLKSDALYYKGKRLDADKDRKYQVVSVGDVTRLVNTSGKIQKASSGKTKVFKDSDDNEFTVSSSGEIVSELPGGYDVKTN